MNGLTHVAAWPRSRQNVATSPKTLTLNLSIDFHARELVVISPRCHDAERNGKKLLPGPSLLTGLNANHLEHRSLAGDLGKAWSKAANSALTALFARQPLAEIVTPHNHRVPHTQFLAKAVDAIVSALPARLVTSFAAKDHRTFG